MCFVISPYKMILTFRPFQDATQGNSSYTISLLDCLQAIKKARELGFFNFQDFNHEEYERLDKIHGGDLNWIVPGTNLIVVIILKLCLPFLYHWVCLIVIEHS